MIAAVPLALRVKIERWPIAGAFTISRGSKTEAAVVVAELDDGRVVGRGECVPYPRYGETVEGVADCVAKMHRQIAQGLDRKGLQQALPPGAARNALDCALWDLEAKRTGRPVYELAGLPPPRPLVTAYTISLGPPEAMEKAAAQHGESRPLLKVKLGAAGDPARIAAVRRAAPKAQLIVDANEGWTAENIRENITACAEMGVTLIEQPLPADADDLLMRIERPVAICADESAHGVDSLPRLRGKYDAINIKLDKTGGLTEALKLARAADDMGFSLMVGCMISTSLAIAPAALVAQMARIVDLDGALLLARDREHGLKYQGSVLHPTNEALWG